MIGADAGAVRELPAMTGVAHSDPFAGIAGHERALGQLRDQLAAGRLSHAYLFAGERGLGKTAVARAFAAALLPEAPLGRNPDYWEDDRVKGISINEIRLLPDREPEAHEQSLQAFLALKPALGDRRVAVISNVGRLPDQCQGILLKTLEEPHPGRVLILTTPSLSPFVVLPTVASRCQRLSFHPVAAAEIERLLLDRGVDSERAVVLAVVSRGRPGWALAAAGDDDIVGRHRELVDRFEAALTGPADVALRLAAEVDAANFGWRGGDRSAEEPAAFAVSSWQLALRRRMAEDPAPGRWARMLERSYDALGHLEQNVSPRLALEVFLLEARRAA
jgi:DNA polymerase-3 subunit delta'